MRGFDDLSMAHTLLHQVLPSALVMAAACILWFWFCRFYLRVEERAWRQSVREPDGFASLPCEVQMRLAIARRVAIGRGSPADRLFFFGLVVSSIAALAGLAIALLR